VHLPFEGVEQSGEKPSFVFHLCGAVTALSTTKSGIEQVPEGVTEHVEEVDDQREEKPRPESQPRCQLHVPAALAAQHATPTRDVLRQPEAEEAQRRLALRQRLFIFYLTTSVGHGLALCSHDKKNLFRLPFCGNFSNYSGNPIFEFNTDFIGLIFKTEKILDSKI